MAGKKDKIKDSNRYSIIAPFMNKCYLCGSSDRVAKHEVFYGSNGSRAKSKEDGLVLELCWYHHNGSNMGVHFNKELDLRLKKQAEKIWIKEYTDHNESIEHRIGEFIKRYSKNYLENSDLEGL